MPEPLAISAKKTLDWAVRVGRARRWSCFDCGSPVPKSKPRFENPFQPLSSRWYCDKCWVLDRRERAAALKEASAEAIQVLELRSRGERIRAALIDLDSSPVLKSDTTARVRRSLPEKIEWLPEESPLFRQLLARQHIQV